MSFHGGLIGVVLLMILYCRKRRWNIRTVGDIVVVPVAIGLALGRFGNFINLELYGSVTSLPWGMSIPGVEGLRHPTQLYAMGKDLMIAGVCFVYLYRTAGMATWFHGRGAALFLMLYGIGRFLNEFLRVQTVEPLMVGPVTLTRGQLLTIPMFIAGLIIWFWTTRVPAAPARVSA
jgi:phosphatidylglycerol:prolipoprotein diacylglycerol transferase